MLRNLVMIVLSFLVAGAMAVIMFLFLRRLRRIEEDKWGKKL